jgi:hypothetical protein
MLDDADVDINMDVDVNVDVNMKRWEERRDSLMDQMSERRNRPMEQAWNVSPEGAGRGFVVVISAGAKDG